VLGLSPLVEKSVEIASQWHDATYRKGAWRPEPFPRDGDPPAGVPVISHLVSTGLILLRLGWDDETVAAGILHDVLEDRDRHGREASRDRLAEMVGEEVAGLVAGVTETKLAADGSFRRWRERKEDYLEALSGGDDRHLAISLADKIHNLWTMNETLESGVDIFQSTETRKGLSAGADQQVWYFHAVLKLAAKSRDPRIALMREGLRAELERFQKFVESP